MNTIEEMKAAFSERFRIDDYTVQIGSRLVSEWAGQQVNAKAVVICEGEGEPVIDQRGRRDSRIELLFYFVDGDPGRYKPSVNREKRTATAYFAFSDLPIVLDVLRNEKPIFGYVNEFQPEATMISTSDEPVGEGEA